MVMVEGGRTCCSIFKPSRGRESWDCVDQHWQGAFDAILPWPHPIELGRPDSVGRGVSSDRMNPGRHDRTCGVRRRTFCGCVRGFARCSLASTESFQLHSILIPFTTPRLCMADGGSSTYVEKSWLAVSGVTLPSSTSRLWLPHHRTQRTIYPNARDENHSRTVCHRR